MAGPRVVSSGHLSWAVQPGRAAALLLASWTGLVVLSLWWNLEEVNRATLAIARSSAEASLNQDFEYRRWAVDHGGIYVTVSTDTPPNPLLANIPDRDVVTSRGKMLTLLSPDHMLRLVHGASPDTHSQYSRVTSLWPRRPDNVPDPWERAALERLVSGAAEVAAVDEASGRRLWRAMRPLVADANCASCHPAAPRGHVLGGLSVAVSFDTIEEGVAPQRRAEELSHGVVWVIGSLALGLGLSLVRSRQAERVASVEMARARDAILDAVRVAAERFLASTDWQAAIDGVLARLGEAAAASRVVIFECVERTAAEVYMSQRNEWAGPGMQPREHDPSLTRIPMRAAGFSRWLEVLARGDVIAGHVRELPSSEQRALTAHGIRSIVVAPVVANGELWGFFAFDQCAAERMWSPAEVEALRAAARIVGEAVERQAIEQELRAQHRFVSAVTRGSPDYITVFDLSAQVEVYRNRPLEPLLGIAQGPRGLGLFDVLSAGEAGVLRAHYAALAEKSDDDLAEVEYHLEVSGGDRWFHSRDSVFQRDPAGRATQVLCVAQDVTARREAERVRARLEDQLLQSQKLEAVGQLAGGVAHDFNNLLTVILGNCTGLSEREDLSPDVAQAILDIDRSANRAASLTRQLLAFSRRQMMRVQPLALDSLVRGVLSMLQRVIGEHITVECDLETGLPPIEGDAGMLEQVIVNLVVNARDAMPTGGHLRLRSRCVQTAHTTGRGVPASDGRFVTLAVSDTGIGFEPETGERLFEPFFTTKAIGKGTGLGLSVAYGIVRQHRGWIEADGRPGEGATFTLYLPASNASVPASVTSVAAPNRLGGTETILVVEDEAEVRELMVASLSTLGYHILEAGNGPGALQIAQDYSDRIDLLVTDMVMPGGLTGRDVAERLKAARPEVKVVYTSGYSLEMTDQDWLGTAVFLPKPYDFAVLRATVRKMLDS